MHLGPSPAIALAHDWALENLDRRLTLGELAEHASLSVRTFSRRFRAEIGTSPLDWVVQRRVERALRMLEETDATVAQIAARVGFGTTAGMRQHFARHVTLSPTTYRTLVRRGLSIPAPRRG